VPATEVARRAGHSVVVLLKMYDHCIDGQADAANKRIADALGGGENGQMSKADTRSRRLAAGRFMPARRPAGLSGAAYR
jgi:hypothetical protein